MHDLCVSLGDCGSKMNYMGMLGRGGYETGSCTTKNPDDDCKKKCGGLGLMGGFSWKSMLSKFISMPA